jgi:hypothetical protein
MVADAVSSKRRGGGLGADPPGGAPDLTDDHVTDEAIGIHDKQAARLPGIRKFDDFLRLVSHRAGVRHHVLHPA